MELEQQEYLKSAVTLLQEAHAGALALPEFEQRFLSLYSELPNSVPDEASAALEEVFWAVEAYVDDPELRRPEDLGPAGLTRAISECLDRLGVR